MPLMKNQLLVSICLLALSGSVAAAVADVDTKSRGQLLYENHCTRCHSSVAHTRTPRRVNNLDELAVWVKKWADLSKLNWSQEELHDVTDYLNAEYYHLKK
jgi:mono/diheme cytochrome c family protein